MAGNHRSGRKRKPTALLKLAGSRTLQGRDPEPEPPIGAPVKPDWLDDCASAKWDELVPVLDEMGVLTKVDGDALAGYCDVFSRWRQAAYRVQCAKSLESEDWSKINRMANDTLAALHRMCGAFGLDPSSRSRMAVKKSNVKRDEPGAEFFKKKA